MALIGNLAKVGVDLGTNFGWEFNNQLRVANKILKKTIPASYTQASDATYLAADILNGAIERNPNGLSRTDTTDSAANILAGLEDPKVGDTFEFVVANLDTGTLTVTVNGGTGVTVRGNNVIGAGAAVKIIGVVTDVTTPAITMYIT